jgi:hypothetical protein
MISPGDGLDHVAGILDATVGNHAHVGLGQGAGAIRHGGHLRHADAGHHTRRADGARPHAHLHRVGTRLGQGQRALGRRHVARDDLGLGEGFAYVGHSFEHRPRMPVRGVHADDVAAGVQQGGHARLQIRTGAHRCPHAQSPELVLGGVGVLLGFLDVLDGDKAVQLARAVDDQQLLDAVLVQ